MRKRIILSVVLVFAVALGCYVVERCISLNNNDVIRSIGSPEVGWKEAPVGSSAYRDSYIGDSIENAVVRVIYYDTDGEARLTVFDSKKGYIKEYNDGVLQDIYDVKTSKLLRAVTFGLYKEIIHRQIRSDDECAQLASLLKNEAYNDITELGGSIITTGSGETYVN